MSWVTDVMGASTAGAAIAEAEGASAAGAAIAAAGAAAGAASFLETFLGAAAATAAAGAATTATAAAAAGAVSFLATFLAAEAAAGLAAELIVLVPVVLFDIFERTGSFCGETTAQFFRIQVSFCRPPVTLADFFIEGRILIGFTTNPRKRPISKGENYTGMYQQNVRVPNLLELQEPRTS